ncbi:MAG: hypothetical protein HZB65_00345 [Candidatus Aenigmarchaeota archaeon]|nr:hypothetical protein [Candidatus Aenigmarchaeota archaeon]
MKLEEYLIQERIWYNFIDKPETIHTADAAEKTGIELKRITKSLILLDQDRIPILCIIPGNCKLSFSRVREVSRVKKVRLVPFDETEKYSGYLPGATPMIHHNRGL